VVRHPSVATLVLARVRYAVSGLSITAGYHRLCPPRRFDPARWFFLAFGAATCENSALARSPDHRAHHANTDGADDPHALHQRRLVGLRRATSAKAVSGTDEPAGVGLVAGDAMRELPGAGAEPTHRQRPDVGP